MKHLALFIALLLCTVYFAHAQEDKPSTAKPKLIVYHKLTPKGDFIKRGEIVYGYEQDGAVYTHTSRDEVSLDTSSPHALYQVKVVDEATKDIVLSTIKSCQLAASGFNDQFIVHVSESGDFTHVDYYSTVSDCFEGAPTKSSEFTTSVEVVRPDQPIKPALGKLSATGQKSPQAAKSDKGEADAPEEEKSFFQKYWYILLGVMVMVITTASQEPPAAQGPAARR